MSTLAPARPRVRRAVVFAALGLWIVASWIPFGNLVLYPFSLMTTWVHEMGHGITALLVGGGFSELHIYGSGGGEALVSAAPGWRDALVALGGLLAPPIVGSAILGFVHGPRRACVTLGVFAGAILVSLVIWVRTAVGFVSMVPMAGLCGWMAWRAWKARSEWALVLAQVLGVVLAVDTVTRMVGYVFTPSVVVNGEKSRSDITGVAEGFGGHYVMWGILVTIVALGLLALGGWRALRKPKVTTRTP